MENAKLVKEQMGLPERRTEACVGFAIEPNPLPGRNRQRWVLFVLARASLRGCEPPSNGSAAPLAILTVGIYSATRETDHDGDELCADAFAVHSSPEALRYCPDLQHSRRGVAPPNIDDEQRASDGLRSRASPLHVPTVHARLH